MSGAAAPEEPVVTTVDRGAAASSRPGKPPKRPVLQRLFGISLWGAFKLVVTQEARGNPWRSQAETGAKAAGCRVVLSYCSCYAALRAFEATCADRAKDEPSTCRCMSDQ